MDDNMVFHTICILILAKLLVELWLAFLNRGEVLRNASEIPVLASGHIDETSYRNSVNYTLANSRFGSVESVIESLLLLIILWSGILPWLYSITSGLSDSGIWNEALFIIVAMMLINMLSLPLEWWGQFRVEAKFGFNNSSLKLWVMDKVKGALLGFIIGFLIIWLLLQLVVWLEDWWWIWGFFVLFGVQLLMMILYPRLILPLFNKLTPLPEGALRERLMALSEKTGFHTSRIDVIDGSRRSGHSNAFFTGFGKFRRIVLYDTLIEQLSVDELEAVLAHEVGHYRKGHIPKRLILMAIIELIILWGIDQLAQSSWFNPAFGFKPDNLAPTFLLVGLLGGVVMFWFTPLGNLLSRKHEYEADNFAKCATGGADALGRALWKLAQKNLSNLTPHPYFSGFYYSHPTLLERIKHLE